MDCEVHRIPAARGQHEADLYKEINGKSLGTSFIKSPFIRIALSTSTPLIAYHVSKHMASEAGGTYVLWCAGGNPV